ncbi:3-ketoacyl-ACP reductase [Lawsonibacter sp. LCP25S3_G6]|uniref:3-ketoacyl-ACP reductase n=1 Tax=unclassified Lawsonibacter TaxID=2617946 RepID=UPI003F993E06
MEQRKTTALVTGGSRGIGLLIARQLGLEGMRVGIVGTGPEERYPEATKMLREAKVDYCWLSGNIGNSEDRQRIVKEAILALGEIRVLVNNAGVAPKQRSDLLEMTEESYDYVVDINTKGTMFLTQMVAKHMIALPLEGRKKRGTIVNISSCSAEVVSLNRGEYCVSKAGVSMLTKLYAKRLAGDLVMVHEVRPGVIATDMTSKVTEKYDHLIENGVFPIARWGTAQDVADMVSILCSDRITYTTGNYIDVDGGFHIREL